MNEQNHNRLEKLSGSNYEIADGQPNIKGWDVKDASGENVGTVKDLIFSPSTRKVRYIVLDLIKSNHDSENQLLLPIGTATLHSSSNDVTLDTMSYAQFSTFERYKGGDILPAQEMIIRNNFEGITPLEYSNDYQHNDDFYEHAHFNEEKFYGNRWVK